MSNCSAITATKQAACKNPAVQKIGNYGCCRIKSHISQVQELQRREQINTVRSPPNAPLAPGVSPLLPVTRLSAFPLATAAANLHGTSEPPILKAELPRASGKRFPVPIINGQYSYKKIKVLGRGAYGVVHEVECDGKRYAIKQQESRDSSSISIPSIVEADILSRISHPNIITAKNIFFDATEAPAPGLKKSSKNIHYKTMINYVMNKEDRQLRGLPLQSSGSLKNMLFQLLSALEYLHRHHVIHADLKPENILVSEIPNRANQYMVTVADFGLSQYNLSQTKDVDVQTFWYRSPEVFARQDNYDTAIDMWSLGLIIRELITGLPLALAGKGENAQLKYVLTKLGVKYDFEDISDTLFTEAYNATKKSLPVMQSARRNPANDPLSFSERLSVIKSIEDNQANASERLLVMQSTERNSANASLALSQRLRMLSYLGATPSVEAILKGPARTDRSKQFDEKEWREYIRLIDGCLVLDPAKRLTAREALTSPLFASIKLIEGSYYKESHSAPPSKYPTVYKVMEKVIYERLRYVNSEVMILAIDLYDRIHAQLQAQDDTRFCRNELALGAVDLALKLNLRLSLPLTLFSKTLGRPDYSANSVWILESTITQLLSFRLYNDNLAVVCSKEEMDSNTLYNTYREVHDKGGNTYDFKTIREQLGL